MIFALFAIKKVIWNIWQKYFFSSTSTNPSSADKHHRFEIKKKQQFLESVYKTEHKEEGIIYLNEGILWNGIECLWK